MFHRRFRRMMRDERGHAIVIGAVGMLIMAITVMASIGIGNGVYQKIKLQDAADAQAYSTAVKEARAFNFFAYTNRAMVVHYVAMMTFMAYVSFAQYLKNSIGRLSKVLQYLPWVGPVFKVIETTAENMWKVADYLARLLVGSMSTANEALPAGLLDLANTALWTAQELVYYATFTDVTTPSGSTPANRTDKNSRINSDGVAGTLSNFQNGASFNKAISDEEAYPGAGTNVRRNLLGKYNAKLSDPVYAHYRLVMANIANAERPDWTAGVKKGFPFIARQFHIGFGTCAMRINIDKVATTQIANYSIAQIKDRIDSSDTLKVWIGWTCFRKKKYFGLDYRNRVAADYQGGFHEESINRRLGIRTERHHYWRGITPFFQGRTSWRNPAKNHFEQPGYLAIATKAMNSDAAVQVIPLAHQQFAINEGTGSLSGSGRFDMTWTGQGQSSGSTLGASTGGMMATAAARAIYHRPGAWQEAPNFFNPLWEAHLTPVMAHTGMAPYLLYDPQLGLFGKPSGTGPGSIVH